MPLNASDSILHKELLACLERNGGCRVLEYSAERRQLVPYPWYVEFDPHVKCRVKKFELTLLQATRRKFESYLCRGFHIAPCLAQIPISRLFLLDFFRFNREYSNYGPHYTP